MKNQKRVILTTLIIIFLVTALMLAVVINKEAETAYASDCPVKMVAGFVYANGQSILIKDTGNDTTTIYYGGTNPNSDDWEKVDSDANGKNLSIFSIYGGKDTGTGISATAKIYMISGKVEEIYGGGKSSDFTGSTNVIISGGEVNTVYGGGFKKKVTGSTNVTISGGKVSKVYGGGDEGDVGGSTTVTITGGEVGTVYGGGYKGDVGDNTNVTITGETVRTVYGGGYYGYVTGDTKVKIEDGEANSVYGGGNRDEINGSTTVTISGSTVENIYGGGNSDKINGSTTVTISGSTVEKIYGGGYKGDVGVNTNVTITGGTVEKIYGGGYYGDVKENANIKISGATVDDIYGGGNGYNVKGTAGVTIDGGTVVSIAKGRAGSFKLDINLTSDLHLSGHLGSSGDGVDSFVSNGHDIIYTGNGNNGDKIIYNESSAIQPSNIKDERLVYEFLQNSDGDIYLKKCLVTSTDFDIYANGQSILISKGTASGTSIYFGGTDADSDDWTIVPNDKIQGNSENGTDLSLYTIYGGGSSDYTGDTRVIITGGSIKSAFSSSKSGTLTGTANLHIDLSADLTLSGVLGSDTVGEGISSFADNSNSITYTGTSKATIAYFNLGASITETSFEKNNGADADYSFIIESAIAKVEASADVEAVDAKNGVVVFAKDFSKAIVTLDTESATYTGSQITAPNIQVVYPSETSGENIPLNATADYSGSFGTIETAGEYTNALSAVENSEYYGTKEVVFTVNKKTVVVDWATTEYKFSGNVQTLPTATYSSEKEGNKSLIVSVADGTSFQEAGVYELSAKLDSKEVDSINYKLENNTKNYTIIKELNGDMISTMSNQTYTGSKLSPTIEVSYLSDGTKCTLGEDDFSYAWTDSEENSVQDLIHAGTYKLTITAAPDSIYSGTATKTFSIDKATATLAIDTIATITFDDSAISADINGTEDADITYTITGDVSGEVAGGIVVAWYESDGTKLNSAPEKAGSYAIGVSLPTTANFSEVSETKQNFSIAQAMQSISYSLENIKKIDGYDNFTNELTQTIVDTVGEAKITYASSEESVATANSTTGEITIVGVGKATITATVGATANYLGDADSYDLVVYAKPVVSTGTEGDVGDGSGDGSGDVDEEVKKPTITNGDDVTLELESSIKLNVEEQETVEEDSADSDVKTAQTAIKTAMEEDEKVSASSVEFLDITLKKVDGVNQDVPVNDATMVIEIAYPYDMSGKQDLIVYRYHNYGNDQVVAEKFHELEERDIDGELEDKAFYYDSENKIAYIYTQYFSTYAFGYSPMLSSSIKLDTHAPTITVDGEIVTISDSNLTSITIDGVEVHFEGSTVEIDLAEYGNGTHEVVATDKYGRMATKTVVVSSVKEEETPSGTEAPQTTQAPTKEPVGGESSLSWLWIVLAVAIAIGIAGYAIYKKKK